MTAVGQAVPRKEDARLLQGEGRYVDNLTSTGMVHAYLVRSPYAHAVLKSVDVSKALDAPGVVAAFTGADLADAWPGGLPCFWPVSDDIVMVKHLPLATDKARFAGDGVAVVVAESRAAAKDAAELVDVEYEPLPAVTAIEDAIAEGAPVVHDDAPGNRAYTWSLVTGDPDKVFADAAVTIKERYRQQRLIPTAMEPRGALCEVNASGDVTIWTATQGPHIMRTAYTLVLGIPEAKIRVIAPDVGGGFGSKLDVYAEDVIVIALAQKLGRPVKWTEERSEGNVATIHGRDVIQEIELAATAEGKITGVRTRLTAAMGAYLQAVTPGVPLLGAWLYAGCYDVEAYDFHCTGVFTNTTPTDAYRGAGRPEATYAIERAVDALARKVGKDPVEIRRLNFIDSFPADIAAGLQIDSGDYHASLDKGLELLDYDGTRAEQERRRASGDVEAARHRLLDLRRDVRARAFEDSRRAALRRGRLGVDLAPRPADGHRADHVRNDAARPGPCDHVQPDRRRPARRRGGRRRIPLRRHRGRPDRYGHLRQPQPPRRRRRAPLCEREGRRQGAADRGAPARGVRRRSRVRSGPVLRQGQPRQGLAREGDRLPRLGGAQPSGRHGAGPRGELRLRPARTSPGPPAVTSRSSRSTPRRATCSSTATSRSTTSET